MGQYDWIWIVIGIYIALKLTKNTWLPLIKGFLGEASISTLLHGLDKEEYKILHNVMIRAGLGTTQIDHIIVSRYGIFVIEVKNYKGWILGSENGREWTQSVYGHKNRFMNPIHQNYGHVKAIESLLHEYDIFGVPIIPIVTFPGDATLKVDVNRALVVKWGNLNNTIRENSSTEYLSKEQMDALVRIFTIANVDSKEAREAHISGIQEKTRAEKRSIKAGICPKCGGNLVKINGKYGSFYGCSNYHKCRYTKNM